MQSDSEIISAHHQTNDDGDEGESEAWLQASTGPERPFKRRRVQGGMFTSRSSQDLPDASDLDDRIRLRFKHNRPHTIPCFTGCPAWSKQLMYVEYQVGSSFAPPSGVTNLAKTSILWQAGHPESWLCSIFANLTDDLATALRDAWLASMILLSEANLMAERSTFNRMRRAVASAIDDVEVITLPSI
jgi:hypothetical protein